MSITIPTRDTLLDYSCKQSEHNKTEESYNTQTSKHKT